MLATAQLAGTMLGESRVERLLGKSPLGAAYLARQPARGRKVLLTTFNFPEELSPSVQAQFLAHFAREGAILLRLLHPHIVPIYETGEQPAYAYLVTAFLKEPSLGQVLKENGRFTSQQSLHILQQLVEALDRLHDQRVMHGMLSLANVIVDSDLRARIAGLGLHTLLEMHGAAQASRPPGHLSSVQGTFLGSPAYISPERVLGSALDGRADVYALGVMLFELLSGTQPFSGTTALETALQRLVQPIPSLHDLYPELPGALDLVIGRALERDPANRYQRAGEFAQAFARVVKAQKVVPPPGPFQENRRPVGGRLTVPPTVNWFDDQITPSGKWQVVPPAGVKTDQAQASVPSAFPPADLSPTSLEGVDPFTWWSSAAQHTGSLPSTTGTFSTRPQLRLATARPQGNRRPDRQERRGLVKLLVAGTVAGALTVGTISITRLIGSAHQSGVAVPVAPATGAGTRTQPQQSASPTARTKPIAPIKPTAPPVRAGTVIGSTALLPNSALRFANPLDGAASLLIHLAGGRFVACERACTHQGIAVNYDPASKMLVCPAHGAIFDPQNHFRHVSGPGSGPLASVSIQVNGDGTITTP